MQEAQYYEKLAEGMVQCHLCPHGCHIRPGREGVCRVRGNREGVLYSLNYGDVTSYGMDAIEKKPLYHFYPGSQVFSVGSWGCNFRCSFCQNWQIAQADPPVQRVTPQELVESAQQMRERNPACIGIAYTYSEPSMWYEFVLDSARLARKAGLKNVFVTNGFLQEEPLRELMEYIDAVNLDVKAFQEGFYNKLCGGKLSEVLRNAQIIHSLGVHLELTMLLIPGLNDREEEIEAFVHWAAGIDPLIPVHFSRYFPNYKLDVPPTPPETLQKAWEIAHRELSYVFVGNLPGGNRQDTLCPSCGAPLIERGQMRVSRVNVAEGRCQSCGAAVPIPGI